MNLNYRAAINCTLYFDVVAEDEDHATDIAEQLIDSLPSSSLEDINRTLSNVNIEIEGYPDIHEN